jgi:hypothetical protein
MFNISSPTSRDNIIPTDDYPSPVVPKCPLLPHLPPAWRSSTMNAFLDAVRIGSLTDPRKIVTYAIKVLQSRLQASGRFADDGRTQDLRHSILIIHGHPAEALALAREALGYVQLSPEAKARRKAVRAEQARQGYMASQAPTEKQLRYLRHLGATELPSNRLEASQLIDTMLLTRRKVSNGET